MKIIKPYTEILDPIDGDANKEAPLCSMTGKPCCQCRGKNCEFVRDNNEEEDGSDAKDS